MIKLGINIDHIATIRQARKTTEPDPVEAAFIAEKNGADQITVHLREDRRHIQDRDVRILREVIQTQLNLEMAPTPEMVGIAKAIHPDSATLVPEKREEVTTEGGVNTNLKDLDKKIQELQNEGIAVSLFIEPDVEAVKKAKKLGAMRVELHTGYFANAKGGWEIEKEIKRLEESAKMGKKLGLYVAAGHGITYHNIYFLLPIKEIEEYNIGHTIISRAVMTGLAEAVREMKRIITIFEKG
jgi:pyridoxine 5-phosphate synthase